MIRPDEIALAVLSILSVQSLYVLVLFPPIWGLVKCCRGKYPRWQHGLWFLLLLRLMLPPDMAVPWSAGHLIRSLTPDMVSRPFFAFPHAPLIVQDHQKLIAVSLPDVFITNGQNSPGMVPTIASRPAMNPSLTALEWFCFIIYCTYFTVVSLLLVLFFCKRRRFWKIARQGKAVLDPAALDIVRIWRRRLHIRRTVKIKVVSSDMPPFTIGLFRPLLVLPEHLVYPAGNAALEPVLAHELVHVKRWDDLTICLQELVRIVYFFHPLVWFVMRRLTWTREAVCDTTVLSYGILSPRTYGRQMLAFVRGQAFPKLAPRGLVEFASAARGMAFRLNHIQKENKMESNPLKMYLTILFLGLFLLPMAPVVSSDQSNITEGVSGSASQTQDRDDRWMADNALIQYILRCVPCQNPEEVSRIIWEDLIAEDFQEEDFSRLVSATDCDIVENIGNGQKAYVFYLINNSRQVHRKT